MTFTSELDLDMVVLKLDFSFILFYFFFPSFYYIVGMTIASLEFVNSRFTLLLIVLGVFGKDIFP